MEIAKIKLEIKKLVEEKISIVNVDENQLLFGVAGGFDSLSLLNFILELESKFDIVIADDDLVPDNFTSIDSIANYISSLLNE